MYELHKSLYDLLIEIDDICRKHDIKYFLAGGCALGAIRNNCFLPWDDDIDLYITRDNWIKLRDLVEEHPEVLPENRTFVCIENTKYHRNPIIRYVKSDTTVVYAAQAFSARTCGQQLEFFVLDPIPNIEDGRQEHIDLQKVYLELLSPYFVANKNASIEDFNKHFKQYKKYYNRARLVGFDKVLDDLHNKTMTYPTEKSEAYLLRWGIRALIHQKQWYEGDREELLEDRKFLIAPMVEHALRVDYGDSWMYIPEGSAQIVHNPIIEDLDRHFDEYTKIYLPRINREKLIKKYTKNKYTNMTLYTRRREAEIAKSNIRRVVKTEEFKRTLVPKLDELDKMLKAHKHIELNEELGEFFKYQLSKNFRRYNIKLDLDVRLFEIATRNLIELGFYYRANQFISLFNNLNLPLTEELEKCNDMIMSFRQLSIAIYDEKDALKVEQLIAENEAKGYGEMVDVARAKLWLMVNKDSSTIDWTAVEQYADKALETYDFDGEIMEYKAMALLQKGEAEAGSKLYEDAVNHTRNGMVWNRCKKATGFDRLAVELELCLEEE